MPLGGYCETCGQWVWVNKGGECPRGHPASSVRHVQELSPIQASSALPAQRAPSSSPSQPWNRWWWRHSLWIVWTFTAGLLNWVAFVYVGLRARRAPWVGAGLLYLVPFVLTIALIGSGYVQYAIALQLFIAAVSVVHAFMIRPYYRAIMFGDAPPGSVPAPPPVLTRPVRAALPRGVSDNVAELMRQAHSRIDEISATAERIAKPEVRDAIGRIAVTADEILEELRKSPGRADLARGFLTYYLDAAHRIVTGYAELVDRRVDTPEVRETTAQAEAALAGIQRAFDGQLNMLLQHELLDLDSEIELLERTVRMDGLMDEASSVDTQRGERAGR